MRRVGTRDQRASGSPVLTRGYCARDDARMRQRSKMVSCNARLVVRWSQNACWVFQAA